VDGSSPSAEPNLVQIGGDVDIRGEPPEHRGVIRRRRQSLTIPAPAFLGAPSHLSLQREKSGPRGPSLVIALFVSLMARPGMAVATPTGGLPSPPPPVSAAPAPAAVPATAPSPRAVSTTKFGVLGIGPASLPNNLAAALEAAAAAGLTASGGDVLARALTVREAGSCDTAACVRGVAADSGARYLLRGTCQIDASTYRVRLELVDGASGTVAAAREDTCEICTEHDVIDATNIAASALKATLDRTATPGTAARVAPAVDLSKRDAAGKTGPAVTRPLWLRVAPWVAFVAAAGAIGAGAYYLSLNDKRTSNDELGQPTRIYDTGWQGGPLIGAGVVAAALGVLALTWTPSAEGTAASPGRTAPRSAPAATVRPTGVSLSPAGFSAWTRF
jgi:hypothetical protein